MIRFLEYRHSDHAHLRRGLVELFQDAIASGASMGYWHPLSDSTAQEFWDATVADVEAGRRLLVVAVDEVENVLGAAQLSLSERQNGANRSELQKLMVHRNTRGQGVGKGLMHEIETIARQRGRKLIVLDTAKGSLAEGMYERLGYQRVGVIPLYTVEVDGSQCDTVIFYKALT